MKKTLAYVLLLAPLLAAVVPFSSQAAFDTASAKTYLAAKPQGPWTVMGLVAAGQAQPALDSLKTVSGNQAISYEAPILALTAAGQNPHTFGSEDFVAKLKSFYTQDQMGDPTSLNDDIFGILALVSAGEAKSSTEITGMKNFIISHQAQNGGWGYAVSAASDTDTTAAAVTALVAAGVDTQDVHIQSALAFMKTNQNTDGGFLSNAAFDSNSNTSSTAWVVWALNATKTSPDSWLDSGKGPLDYLAANQNAQGWFADQVGGQENGFTPITTAYAIIALSGKTLPLRIVASQPSQSFAFRIEGSNEQVCEGTVAAITALDVVKNAASQCGYSYNIQDTQYGPYLNQIGNDAAANLTGWQYAVNLTIPSVGAADYQLQTNDQVLWYYGGWDDKLTRLSLDKAVTDSGQSSTATLEYNNGGTWQPLAGASLNFGTTTVSTNEQGQANLSGADGYYRVFAQKPGFVRSNAVLLKIGQPQNSSVSLSVNVPGVNGTDTQGPPPSKPDIAFSVNPGSLDFGDLAAGQQSEKSLSISNTGNKNLQIQAVVDGQDVFKDNLKLQNQAWEKYQAQINSGSQANVSAELSIPASFPGYGQMQGEIIFWAQAE